MKLDNQCIECKYGEDPCPVAFVQITYNYDQVGNDLARKIMNDLVSEEGVCQMKKVIDAKQDEDYPINKPHLRGFMETMKFEGFTEGHIIDQTVNNFVTIKGVPKK